jgi:hypothetical protein
MEWLRTHLTVVAATGCAVVVACACGGDEEQSEARTFVSTTCATCRDSTGDLVIFPVEVGTERSGLVLFSGWRKPQCEVDILCAATSELHLGDVRWGLYDFAQGADLSAGCKKELIAFTAGKAPYVGDSPGDEIFVDFRDARAVKVKVWVVYPPSTAEPLPPSSDEWSEADANTAQRVYEELGTGIALTFESASVRLAPANGAFSCSRDAATLATLLDAGMYDKEALNVYYVDKLEPGYAGVNCYSSVRESHQEIILVDRTRQYAPMQLAHEIGHALGLLRSQPLSEYQKVEEAEQAEQYHLGDVDELYLDPFLATDNLMRSNGTVFNSVTVGQIYRMHFDKLSWLNRKDIPSESGYPRVCQDDPSARGVCPPLTLNPPRGWP